MMAYNLTVMAEQETHQTGSDIEIIRTTGNTLRYMVHNSRRAGEAAVEVAIIMRSDMRTNFIAVSSRLCMLTVDLKSSDLDRKLVVVGAHAPTLPVSEQNLERRDKFYDIFGKQSE